MEKRSLGLTTIQVSIDKKSYLLDFFSLEGKTLQETRDTLFFRLLKNLSVCAIDESDIAFASQSIGISAEGLEACAVEFTGIFNPEELAKLKSQIIQEFYTAEYIAASLETVEALRSNLQDLQAILQSNAPQIGAVEAVEE